MGGTKSHNRRRPKARLRAGGLAKGAIKMKAATFKLVREDALPKGDCWQRRRWPASWRPSRRQACCRCATRSCSPRSRLTLISTPGTRREHHRRVKNVGKTGVEMEALTSVAISALTIYDMCKSVDPEMRIESIRLARKSGGKSGEVVFE